MAIPKMYNLQRTEGKLAVEIDGGVMPYSMLSNAAKAWVTNHPNVQSVYVNPGMPDPFIDLDFECDLFGLPEDTTVTEVAAPAKVDLGASSVVGEDEHDLYLLRTSGDLVPFSPIAQQISATIAEVAKQLHEKTDNALLTMGEAMQVAQAKSGTVPVIVTVKVSSETTSNSIDGLFHSAFPSLVKYMSAGAHCYLPGSPGTGKTHAAQQACKVLGWRFESQSCGPMTPNSTFWGGRNANGEFQTTPLIESIRYAQDHPESGAAFLYDEMDNGSSSLFVTMNTVMANGFVTLGNGETLEVGPNWVALGAANTFGTGPTAQFAGRNKIDAATLDRFIYVPWEIDEGMETTIIQSILQETTNGMVMADTWLKTWRTSRRKVGDNGLPIFVTMRGAIQGAKLLRAGIPIREVWNVCLGNKLKGDIKTKVTPW